MLPQGVFRVFYSATAHSAEMQKSRETEVQRLFDQHPKVL
jgi:hypothetical protein